MFVRPSVRLCDWCYFLFSAVCALPVLVVLFLFSAVCALPVLVGGCSDSLARFYYDPASQLCKPFTYTGCSGNQNNFASLQDCQNICSSKYIYRYTMYSPYL